MLPAKTWGVLGGAGAGAVATAINAYTAPRRPEELEVIRAYDEARKNGKLDSNLIAQKQQADEAYRKRGGGGALLKAAGTAATVASLGDAFTGNHLQRGLLNRTAVPASIYLASNKRPYKFIPRAITVGSYATLGAGLYGVYNRLKTKPTEEEKAKISRANEGLAEYPDAFNKRDMTSRRGRRTWDAVDKAYDAQDAVAKRGSTVNPYLVGLGAAGATIAAPFLKDAAVGLGRALSKSERINRIRGLRTLKTPQANIHPSRLLNVSRDIQVVPPKSYIDVPFQ